MFSMPVASSRLTIIKSATTIEQSIKLENNTDRFQRKIENKVWINIDEDEISLLDFLMQKKKVNDKPTFDHTQNGCRKNFWRVLDDTPHCWTGEKNGLEKETNTWNGWAQQEKEMAVEKKRTLKGLNTSSRQSTALFHLILDA